MVPGYTWEVVKLDKSLEPEMRGCAVGLARLTPGPIIASAPAAPAVDSITDDISANGLAVEVVSGLGRRRLGSQHRRWHVDAEAG